MNHWKYLLANQAETLSERKERIRARAHMLKDRRENERKEFVQEMYAKQWRDANDDARTLDSQAIMDKLLRDRKASITYKEGDGKIKEVRTGRKGGRREGM